MMLRTRNPHYLNNVKKAPLVKEAFILLSVCGLNPLKQNTIAKIIAAAITLSLIAVTAELLVDLVVNWKGLDSMFNIAMGIGIYQMLVKIFSLVFNRQQILHLLYYVEDFWQFSLYEEVKPQVEPIYDAINLIFKYGLVGVVSANLIFCVTPVAFRTLLFSTYHPLNLTDSPDYELMFSLQFFASVLGTIAYFGFELLFMFFIICIACEFQVLKEAILRLPAKFHKCGDEDKALQELAVIVDQHNYVLRFINELNDCYSMLILNHSLSSMFCISSTVVTVLAKGMADRSEFIRHALFGLAYTGLFFIYCFCGTVLTTACEDVLDAVLESDWYIVKQPSFRKGVIMVIQRAQKVEKITVGGMFDLNLATFKSVANGAMSYAAVFQAISRKGD